LLSLPEDLKRAGFYQDNAKRASLQKQVGGVDAYLASLDMTITFQPFDATWSRAHRPAHQQVQPVQPHHPPLHRP
jgi:predicted enzyme involved in methoxymalonyl-ACP biosynthesis